MKEAEISSILRNKSEEYKKIEDEHRKLEQSLDEINKKKYLSPDEEVERKKIQKQKLYCKDRMARLIRAYK